MFASIFSADERQRQHVVAQQSHAIQAKCAPLLWRQLYKKCNVRAGSFSAGELWMARDTDRFRAKFTECSEIVQTTTTQAVESLNTRSVKTCIRCVWHFPTWGSVQRFKCPFLLVLLDLRACLCAGEWVCMKKAMPRTQSYFGANAVMTHDWKADPCGKQILVESWSLWKAAYPCLSLR